MKLKNTYVLRTVADKTVAIAVDKDGEKSDSVITLNSTGAFIFNLVNKGSDKEDIYESFFKEYEVSKEEAQKAVDSFIDNLVKSGLAEE